MTLNYEDNINRLIQNRLNEIERLHYFIRLNDLYSLEPQPTKRIIPKPLFNYNKSESSSNNFNTFEKKKKKYEQQLKNWEKEKKIEEIKWIVSVKIWNKKQKTSIETKLLYLDYININRIEILELEEIKKNQNTITNDKII